MRRHRQDRGEADRVPIMLTQIGQNLNLQAAEQEVKLHAKIWCFLLERNIK
jgi:hypothetical protein